MEMAIADSSTTVPSNLLAEYCSGSDLGSPTTRRSLQHEPSAICEAMPHKAARPYGRVEPDAVDKAESGYRSKRASKSHIEQRLKLIASPADV